MNGLFELAVDIANVRCHNPDTEVEQREKLMLILFMSRQGGGGHQSQILGPVEWPETQPPCAGDFYLLSLDWLYGDRQEQRNGLRCYVDGVFRQLPDRKVRAVVLLHGSLAEDEGADGMESPQGAEATAAWLEAHGFKLVPDSTIRALLDETVTLAEK
jgi:hypothetical protein